MSWTKYLLLLSFFNSLVFFFSGCGTLDSPSGGAASRDEAVKLQIFLDSQNFGPGIVDGQRGEFTAKALALYRHSKGLPEEYKPDLSGVVPYRDYVITQADIDSLGQIPAAPAKIAQLKKMPYTKLSELLGERFHTTRAFIYQLNPNQPIEFLPAGSVIKVPNVSRPFYPSNYPGSYKTPPPSLSSKRSVLVDTNLRMLEVREGDRLIAAFPITPGSSEHPAPKGNWKIVKAVPWPWYRYDEGVLDRGVRTETFYMYPPGVNSPVGILWAGLNRSGIGIHGTGTPETIGRSGSHGCIRLANWDAATFYTLIRAGVPVTIR
ncbi:MAG: L,D-transpeptidase family protein [Chthoniobacterales bacterium]